MTVLRVQARPGSARDEVVWDDTRGCWTVRVRAQAQQGEANRALLKTLATALSVDQRGVRLIGGLRSRAKRVEVEGLAAEEVERRLRLGRTEGVARPDAREPRQTARRQDGDGIAVIEARTAVEIREARRLVEEYVDSLEIDLDFQDFSTEISSFPGEYRPPAGTVLVAYDRGRPVGVVALRPLEAGGCEMKRMYVVPDHRRKGIGRVLSERLVEIARRKGYRAMRLDTLGTMHAALELYRTLGFREIPAYRYNPIVGAKFLELELRPAKDDDG